MMCDGGSGLTQQQEIDSFLSNAIDSMIRGIDQWENSFFQVIHEKGDSYTKESLKLQYIDTMDCWQHEPKPHIEIIVKRYRRANFLERWFKMYDRQESWMPEGYWVLLSDHLSGAEEISIELRDKIIETEKNWQENKGRQLETKSSQRLLAERRHRLASTYYNMER